MRVDAPEKGTTPLGKILFTQGFALIAFNQINLPFTCDYLYFLIELKIFGILQCCLIFQC